MTDRQLIGSPYTLPCGYTLPNRMVKASLEEDLADPTNSYPPMSPMFKNLYGRWSRAKYGMILTGHIVVTRGHVGLPGDVCAEKRDFNDPKAVEAWKEYARVCKSGNPETAIVAQINHVGRQCYSFCHAEGDYPIGPSDQGEDGFGRKIDVSKLTGIKSRGFMYPARGASRDEMQELINRFADTAEFVKSAGFEGIQIHGAHGYQHSQFLSPKTNKRTDEFGGTAANRREYLIRCLTEIRKRCGPKFIMGVKLNSADFTQGGLTSEESIEHIRALRDMGVDFVEISGGTYESGAFYGAEARHKEKKDSTIKREAYFLEFAEQCRRAVPNFCLMVTGGFRSRTGMGAALRSGSCDLIGLGRPACIDPDLPLRILQTSDSVPDVRCVDYDPDGRVKDKRARGVDVMAHTAQMRRIALGLEPDPKMDIVDLLEGSKGDWLHLTQVYGKPESNGVWKL